MPIPEDLCKVQLTFDLMDGSQPIDVAVTGFWFHRAHAPGAAIDWQEDVQEAAEGIRDRWVEHIGTGLFSNAVKASVCKVFHVNAAGLTIDEGIAAFEGAAVWRGGQNPSLPWECSPVLTTYAYGVGQFVQNRARRRGRMFLPPVGTGSIAGDQGRLSDTAINNLADAFGAFFNDVQGLEFSSTIGGTDYVDLAIVSKVGNSWAELERFQVGNVVDAQRRRRNEQVEVYAGALINR